MIFTDEVLAASSKILADNRSEIDNRIHKQETITWSDSHLLSWTHSRCCHRFGHSARRVESKRIGAPTARVALPRWKYPRVAPETISLRGLPHQKWVSEQVSEWVLRPNSSCHFVRTLPDLLPPHDTNPGKREHRELPVNYVYKTFHKRSADGGNTIEILNEMFAILSLLFGEETENLWVRELRDLNACSSMSGLRIYVLESLKFRESKNKGS